MKNALIMTYLTAIGFALASAYVLASKTAAATFAVEQSAAAATALAMTIIPMSIALAIDRISRINHQPDRAKEKGNDQEEKRGNQDG